MHRTEYYHFFIFILAIFIRNHFSFAAQVNLSIHNNVNTFVSGESKGNTLKPGQNVCKRERVVQIPVKYPQTYIRPVYHRFMEPCTRTPSGYCSVLRVVYQTSVRHVVRLDTKHQVMYSCCPGWTRIDHYATDCLKPICGVVCKNGGSCVAPNKCMCPRQWTGQFCEIDVDECKTQMDKCQQICINQDGTYTCACHRGFLLQNDGRTCTLCLSCTTEFKQMQAGYKQMNKRVLRLEREKAKIRKNLTKLKKRLRQCTQHKCQSPKQEIEEGKQKTSSWALKTTLLPSRTIEPTEMTITERYTNIVSSETTTQTTTKATTPKTTTTTKLSTDNPQKIMIPITDKPLKSIEYMINSLSEQISILEERLEECTCQQELSQSHLDEFVFVPIS